MHSITPGYPIREPYAGDCRVPISVSVLSQPDADKINESVSSNGRSWQVRTVKIQISLCRVLIFVLSTFNILICMY